MKIAVFGATGGTGRQIVKQALESGFEVKAFARDRSKIELKDPKLEIIEGDILKPETVDRAVSGTNVALVALGANTPILAEGTKNIIESIKKHGTKRLVVESSYAFSGSEEGVARLKSQGMIDEQIASFQPILDDKAAQEKETRESGLEYVVVRPLALTDGEKTGEYRIGEKLELEEASHISRADVADFMLKALKDDQWLGKTVYLAY